jgi:A/G-specific adenine glycosylase
MNDTAIRRKLLRWYDKNRRTMPWREHSSAYRTWISEIMLQQTQVATVIPYFERFVKKFKNVEQLAHAKEADVLRLWAGLGYYSRARNLKRAAETIVKDLDGRFPEDIDGLRKLPGIGPYTAAAIASIAFEKPRELVDGNVARVLTRLFGLHGNVKSPAMEKKLWATARRLIHKKRPGDWNQALMEQGALVCLPSPDTPHCNTCALREDCIGLQRGIQDELPEMPSKRPPVHLQWTGLDIGEGARQLLWLRSDKEKFLRGHWGLPESRHLRTAQPGQLIRTITHSITHHRITLSVRKAKAPAGPLPKEAKWVPKRELKRYLVSSLWHKAKKIPPRN